MPLLVRALAAPALLCFLAGCSHEPSPNQVILSYTEKPGSCINCPLFKVDFRSGGEVSYECLTGCAVPGKRHYSVPPERFTGLLQAFRNEHFFGIPERDNSVVYDAPIFRLAYRDNRRTHVVVDNFRGNASLLKLEKLFRIAVDPDRYALPSARLYDSLVKSGWNVNTVGRDQQNALTSALASGDLESARFLLTNGSVVTAEGIDYAARSSNSNILRYVLDSGVAPNQREPFSELTPLLSAMESDRLENTVLLLDHGANPNVGDARGRRPLWYAATAANTGFIQVLLQHGADVNAKDDDGNTALINATRRCCYWDMEALLKAGADPTLKNKESKTAHDVDFSLKPKCQAARKLINKLR